MTRLEKDEEKLVRQWVEDELGGDYLRLRLDGRRGWPDGTIFAPGGILLLPEMKRSKNAARRKQQELRIERLTELGFHSDFCWSLEQVQKMYDVAKNSY